MKKTSETILIKNGRVIDPLNGIDKVADVYIKEGKVEAIGKLDIECDNLIDATNKLVTPGLIDIHVHFREPGDEEEETISSGSMAAVAGGFTSVVCMPNTDPAIDNEAGVEFIHRMGRQARKTHVYVMGAITQNRKGEELAEMGLMAKAGAVGFTDDGAGIQNAVVMGRALKYASMFDLVVSQHCQDNQFAKGGAMHAGFNSTLLGLPGIDALAEEMMLWRDIQLVKKTTARYHAQHLSTKGAIDIVRDAKAKGVAVTCEVTPHHLLFTDDCIADYDTNYKVNPPLRTQEDVDAIKQAVKDGIIDALVTDHAPHLLSEKELEFLAAPFGIAGLECALSLYIKALIEPDVISWSELIAMMTYKPAQIIKIDDSKGSLTIGHCGDVVVFDPEAEYKVDANKFYSKARNCPYNGWNLKGKVEYTIVGGEIRYKAV